MKHLFYRAGTSLFFGALLCVHPVANAEETKTDSAAQSGVAAQESKDQAKDSAAKPAKTDETKKKSSSEPEPECNN